MAHRINERNSSFWTLEGEPKKRTNKTLTTEEKALIKFLLRKVENTLQEDGVTKTFTDGGRFICSLELPDICLLNGILDKL